MGTKCGYLPYPKSFETVCIHHSHDPKQWKSQALIPHIVMSTVFHIDDPAKPGQFIYSRFQNPTRYILENVVAAINGGKHGFCFASGLSTIMGIFGALKHGDHIVACEEMDGEKYDLFNVAAKNCGIHTSFADFTNLNSVCCSIQDNTKLFWAENPTDAKTQIIDVATIAKIAKPREILFAVDNTCLTPFLQRPLELGADFACQSATKYLNGHSDVSMGCLSMIRDDLVADITKSQVGLGLVPSPFDCSQVLRGTKTLHIRMEQHFKNSLILANFLEQHLAVERVCCPGLKSHPQHELLKTQASGCGGVFSFYLKTDLEGTKKFVKNLHYFTLTDVSGGAESTVSIPILMSHKGVTENRKENLCITDNLVKISVGLENICHLILDLDTALGCIQKN